MAFRQSKHIETLTETQYAFVLLSPALLFVAIIAFWPIFWTLWISLHADATATQFVGFGNYVDIFTGDARLDHPFIDMNQPFRSALPVTLIITVGVVILTMALGFVQAMTLNKSFKGRGLMRVLIILPWAVPIVIQGMIFHLLFTGSVGVGSEWLHVLGFANADAPLAYSRESTLIIILAQVWKHSAFVAIIVLAGLQSIDRTLYDVGKVSGATRWQQFKTITFPLVIPSLLIALIFRTIESMRIYGVVVSVSSCDIVPTLACVVINEFGVANYALSAALAVLLAMFVALIVSVYLAKFASIDIGGT